MGKQFFCTNLVETFARTVKLQRVPMGKPGIWNHKQKGIKRPAPHIAAEQAKRYNFFIFLSKQRNIE